MGMYNRKLDADMNEMSRIVAKAIKEKTGNAVGRQLVYDIMREYIEQTAAMLKEGKTVAFGRLGRFDFSDVKSQWRRNKYTNWWWVIVRPQVRLRFVINRSLMAQARLLTYKNRDWENDITDEMMAQHPEDDAENGYPKDISEYNIAWFQNKYPNWKADEQLPKPDSYPLMKNQLKDELYGGIFAESDEEDE